jgi:hypothetical protein
MADAAEYLGVYKRLSDVPPSRRLATFADEYRGRDAFAEFVDARGSEWSDRWRDDMQRAGRRWREHIEARTDASHPGLVLPDHVESFFRYLMDGSPRPASVGTVRRAYQPAIEGFFDWMLWSADHPHCYSPVLMAYDDPGNEYAPRVWSDKAARRVDA